MAFHAAGVGIGAERAEFQREPFLVFHGDVLVAEIDHLVAEQGGFDFFELPIADAGDIRTPDLRAHGAGQGYRADFRIAVDIVVVVRRGIKLHCQALRLI